MRAVLRRPLVVGAIVGTVVVALPAVALAVHPVAGALYTGNSGKCSPSIAPQCVFKFRVSSDKKTLRFVKKSKAISSWVCQGGGGEAIFGSGTNEYPIPPAHIHANGSFAGSGGSGTMLLRISGSFATPKTATLKFTVTAWPTTDGSGVSLVMLVVVFALSTWCGVPGVEALPLKFASPA